VNEAKKESLLKIRENISKVNPSAKVMVAPSVISVDRPEWIEGRRVLVVEDGPTITHGGMSEGAGAYVSKKVAREMVDPRPYAVGSLKEVFERYPHIGKVLPAMGYSEAQVKELEETIGRAACDTVVLATPADLRRKIRIDSPIAKVTYDFDIDLGPVVEGFLRGKINMKNETQS
jgi:predicted GTPase